MKPKDIKSKVKSKVKGKVEKKIGRKVKAVIGVIGLAVMLVGCGSYPAAYSVTQDNKFDGCSFYFGGTNSVHSVPSVEMFTLAQNLENQGTQTADQKSTNEIKPDTDVTVGGASSGGTGKGLLENTVDAVANAFKSESSSVSATSECSTGNCSSGACTDGSCSVK